MISNICDAKFDAFWKIHMNFMHQFHISNHFPTVEKPIGVLLGWCA